MPAERIPPACCIRCGALWLTDAIANVALFVPFGLGLAVLRRPLWQALVVALLFSSIIELLQSIGLPPGRSPALADIVTNTTGAALGAIAYEVLAEERTRSVRTATWLAIAWAVLAVGVFTLTARALQQVEPANDRRIALGKSPFRHVPGHGWYEGITDSAAVEDTVVRRG